MNLERVTQLRTNIVRDVKGDLVADFHSILNKQQNHFSQLLNVFGIYYVRQTEIHTAEPILREPSAFGVEVTTEKLKRYKSPGTDQILAEMIKAGVGQFTLTSINIIILFGKRGFATGVQGLNVTVIKQIVIVIVAYLFYPLRIRCYLTSICQG